MRIHPSFTTLVLAGASAAAVPAQVVDFAAFLDGSKEVPPNASTASGWARIRFDAVSNRADVFLATDLSATAAHLHDGAPGQNGPILFGLTRAAPGIWKGSGTLGRIGGINFLNGLTYLNVHTAAFPAGEIRAQAEQSLVNQATGDIDGARVVPPATPGAIGRASLTLYRPENRLVYDVSVANPTGPLAAKLHLGPSGSNGPEIATLRGAVNGAWLGSVRLSAAQVAAFGRRELYVEVSTATDMGIGRADPDGAEEFVSGSSKFRARMAIRDQRRWVQFRLRTTDLGATSVDVGLPGQNPIFSVTPQSPGQFGWSGTLSAPDYQQISSFSFITVNSPNGGDNAPLFPGQDPLPIGRGHGGPSSQAGWPFLCLDEIPLQLDHRLEIRGVDMPANAPVVVMLGRPLAEPLPLPFGASTYHWFNDARAFAGGATNAAGSFRMPMTVPFNTAVIFDPLGLQAAGINGIELFNTQGLEATIY